MRIHPLRTSFACLIALLAGGACNAIFGIQEGTPGGTGGDGSTSSSATSSSTGTPSSTTSSSSGTTSSSSSTASSSSSGGAPCTPSTTQCSGSSLQICDSGGQLTTVACDVPAACDAIAGVCRNFDTGSGTAGPHVVLLPRLALSQGVGCAVEDDRSVKCWGDNYGSDGSNPIFVGDLNLWEVVAKPIAGSGGAMGAGAARQVSVTDDHGCYLTDAGQVMCWGSNSNFQVGGAVALSANPSPPVQVQTLTGTLEGVVEVGVLPGCSCARMAVDGSLQCWGVTGAGCPVDATTMTGVQDVPTPVAGITGAVSLRMGIESQIGCVRLVGRTVTCWSPGFAPAAIPGVTDAADVEPGNGVVYILSSSLGVLVSTPTMGDGGDQIGWTEASALPAYADYGGGAISRIAAGDEFLALRAADGAVTYTTWEGASLPSTLGTMQPLGTVVELAAGQSGGGFQDGYQCLRVAAAPDAGSSIAASVYCWGDDGIGALGCDAPDWYRTYAVPAVSNVTALATSDGLTVAVLGDGSVECWGQPSPIYTNGSSPLPYGEYDTPTAVSWLGTGNTAVTITDGNWSGSSPAGYALSGGAATYFEYGAPVTTDPGIGLADSGFSDFVDARSWSYFDIGLRKGGTIVVYARMATANVPGVLGIGMQMPAQGTIQTVPGITTATAIASSCDGGPYASAHVCAILGPSGSVSCWGFNESGEIGIGGQTGVTIWSPTPVTLPGAAVSIAAGESFTCAVIASGNVYCWGDNSWGQLGTPGPGGTPGTSSTTPVQVPGVTGAAGVAAFSDFACAWLTNGNVQCWGDNTVGQLGNGTLGVIAPPGNVVGPGAVPLAGVMKVSTGGSHACAIRSDKSVACWGYSWNGQVGAGLVGIFQTPQQVQGL
jgi:alpha-tubulin suppressor-like RCC1 family protein